MLKPIQNRPAFARALRALETLGEIAFVATIFATTMIVASL